MSEHCHGAAINGRKGRTQGLQIGSDKGAHAVVIEEAVENQKKRTHHDGYNLAWNFKYLAVNTREGRHITIEGKDKGDDKWINRSDLPPPPSESLRHSEEPTQYGKIGHHDRRLELLWGKQEEEAHRGTPTKTSENQSRHTGGGPTATDLTGS